MSVPLNQFHSSRLCEKCLQFTQAKFFRAYRRRGGLYHREEDDYAAAGSEDVYLPIQSADSGAIAEDERAFRTSFPTPEILSSLELESNVTGETSVMIHKTGRELAFCASLRSCDLCYVLFKSDNLRDSVHMDMGTDAPCILTLVPQPALDPPWKLMLLSNKIWGQAGPSAKSRRDEYGDTHASVFDLRQAGSDFNVHTGYKFEHGFRSDTRDRLLTWIGSCQSDHECGLAGTTLSQNQPSRFVRIKARGTRFATRLVEVGPAGLQSKYVALSHCWGSSGPTVKLLRENHAQWLADLPYETLPQTFKDAVMITSTLGMQYLWIDALCIIQDSDSDWNKECTTMRSVFSRSTVTIAATAATDSNEGLLLQAAFPTSCIVRISYIQASVRVRRTRGDEDVYKEWDTGVEHARLSQRAWAFQEMLLAPRIIHFTNTDIWWTCRRTVDRENPTGAESLIRISQASAFRSHVPGLFEHGDWGRLIEQYSRKKLTYSSDKLAAFGGVAEAFGKRHGLQPSDYAAGLWFSQFRDQLLWQPGDGDAGQTLSDRDTGVAPSWSWASHDGPVRFMHRHISLGEKEKLSDWSRSRWNRFFEANHVEITPGTGSQGPFGALQEGYVDVTALVLRVLSKNEVFLRCEGSRGSIYTMSVHLPWRGPLGATHALVASRDVSQWDKFHINLILLQRQSANAGHFIRTGAVLVHSAAQSALDNPEWWNIGCDLKEDEYLEAYGAGRYRIRII